MLKKKVASVAPSSSVQMASRNARSREGNPPLRTPWVPPAGLKDYYGRDLTAEDKFFQPPPPELGGLLAAQTGLKTTRREAAPRRRMALYAGLLMLLCASCFGVYQVNWDGDTDPAPWVVCSIVVFVIGLGGLLAIHAATKFWHLCSYVGTNGLAIYEIRGGRAATPNGLTFTYDKATEIRRSEIYKYVKGVQTRASFVLTWSDAQGNVVFSIKGQAPYRIGRPTPRNHRYLVGRAAEAAWCDRLVQSLDEVLRRDGAVTFTIRPGRMIRLWPGTMELRFGDRHRVIPAADIQRLSLANGQFSIRSADAKMFGDAGKYIFPYSEIANAQLFIFCCEKLLNRPLD